MLGIFHQASMCLRVLTWIPASCYQATESDCKRLYVIFYGFNGRNRLCGVDKSLTPRLKNCITSFFALPLANADFAEAELCTTMPLQDTMVLSTIFV